MQRWRRWRDREWQSRGENRRALGHYGFLATKLVYHYPLIRDVTPPHNCGHTLEECRPVRYIHKYIYIYMYIYIDMIGVSDLEMVPLM